MLVYSDFEEPYEYDWNTEFEFEDANHIIGSIVTDLAGNQFEIPSISVFVNNIPKNALGKIEIDKVKQLVN